jgi:enoyl-CoA hydratase/3-hydroxypropionyl-coenzyme A dehydratase
MDRFKYIELDCRDDLGIIRFNRPEQLNAMNRGMMDEIIDALEMLTADQRIRVAVITGKGRAFMAGADIKEYAEQTPEEFADFRKKGMRLYELVEHSGIPFIAAVNGFALGGGFEIALSCDFILAADTSLLGLPEIHIGLIPGGGGLFRLLQKTGLNRAREAVLLGQSYTAAEMSHWGVVYKVVPEHELMEQVMQLAEKLKRRPARAVKLLKEMLRPEQAGQSFRSRMDEEGRALFELFHTAEAKALIHAFAQKNKHKQ